MVEIVSGKAIRRSAGHTHDDGFKWGRSLLWVMQLTIGSRNVEFHHGLALLQAVETTDDLRAADLCPIVYRTVECLSIGS